MNEFLPAKTIPKNRIELFSIPPVAQKVYKIIEKKGCLKFKELKEQTTYSERRLRDAIKILQELNLIEKEIDLHDLRSYYFQLKK